MKYDCKCDKNAHDKSKKIREEDDERFCKDTSIVFAINTKFNFIHIA